MTQHIKPLDFQHRYSRERRLLRNWSRRLFMVVLGNAPGFIECVQMLACTGFGYRGTPIASGPLSGFGIQPAYPVNLTAFLKL